MAYQGSEFDSRVVLAQEVKISTLSKSEILTVGTIAKKLDLTVEPSGEMSVMITGHPQNAGFVFIGLNNTVTASDKWFTVVSPSEKMVLTLNTDTPCELWAIGTSSTDKVAVLKIL